ncbi:MAG: class II fructose-bisphosphate aldolase [Terriglobia bacterium]
MHIRDLFKSRVSSFAYPAFNTQNLEITLGIVQAAEEVDAPVIIATSDGTAGYAGIETIAAIVRTVADGRCPPGSKRVPDDALANGTEH